MGILFFFFPPSQSHRRYRVPRRQGDGSTESGSPPLPQMGGIVLMNLVAVFGNQSLNVFGGSLWKP